MSIRRKADAREPGAGKKDEPERLVVAPKDAWRMLGCGPTHGYEMLQRAELESYLDGRARRISVASIKDYVARRLAAGSGEMRGDLVERAARATKEKRRRWRAGGDIDKSTDTIAAVPTDYASPSEKVTADAKKPSGP